MGRRDVDQYRYEPGLGGAFPFPATPLHEVTPVLKGERYVLLIYVHDADAEARRLKADPEVAPASIKVPVLQ